VVPEGRFEDEHFLKVGSTEFHCEHPVGTVPPGRLPVAKPRRLVEAYVALCTELRPRRVVEVGIYKGGSTAMLHALTEAEKIVAIELSEQPVEVLERYIDDRSLRASVRPYYGVDQSDRARVTEIVEKEFAGAPIDLVVDDASHLYRETKVTFETLFPYLRPGGVFVFEDWRWQQIYADGIVDALEGRAGYGDDAIDRLKQQIAEHDGSAAPTTPVMRLVVEMFLACATSPDVVTDVAIDPHWVSVRRGERPLQPGAFRLDDVVRDHFGFLPATP
jgi:predicted O-methyltransferase YrrM